MHNYLQDEMIDMEKAMTAILQNHKGVVLLSFIAEFLLIVEDVLRLFLNQEFRKLPSSLKERFNYSTGSAKLTRHQPCLCSQIGHPATLIWPCETFQSLTSYTKS